MNRAGMKHAAMGGMWRQPQQRHVQIASSSSSCISMYNARCGQATHRHRLSHSIRAHATVTLNMLNGETHEIEVESDETILEACLREGIEWSHDCKLGMSWLSSCRICRTKLTKYSTVYVKIHTNLIVHQCHRLLIFQVYALFLFSLLLMTFFNFFYLFIYLMLARWTDGCIRSMHDVSWYEVHVMLCHITIQVYGT